jgi:hypothetical protein
MTEQVLSANWTAEPPQLGMRALWRLAIWGGGATFALFIGVISVFFSGTGLHRQTASAATGQISTVQTSPVQGVAQPQITAGDFAPRANETAEETRRLAETVRTLAADRDQALSRIAALERDLDGVTGAIKHDRAPALPSPPPLQPPPSPSAAVTPKTAAPMTAAPMTEAAVTPAPTPASQPSATGPSPLAAPVPDDHAAPASDAVPVSAEPLATGAGLGVDIGGAGNYEGLRTLWRSTKNNDPALLEELYPLVAVRENGKTHGADLRLVIGPLDDAESAARLCATLAAAHHYCQPVAFEGQRFSMNDAGPTKAPPAMPSKAAPHHSAASSPGPKVFAPAPVAPVIHFEK